MYFFKNTAGNWIIGPEPTSLKSKVASELRRDAPTVVTVRTIETRVLLIDRMEVTEIKKNAEGDFYTSYAEFLTAVSDFFDNAPITAEEVDAKIGAEVDTLSDRIDTVEGIANAASSGSLGSIKPTDAAPTPQRNGNYTFSIGGNKPAWLTAEAGITTVKAGDGVSVVYTAPSSYTYTHVNVSSEFLARTDFKLKSSGRNKFDKYKAVVGKTIYGASPWYSFYFAKGVALFGINIKEYAGTQIQVSGLPAYNISGGYGRYWVVRNEEGTVIANGSSGSTADPLLITLPSLASTLDVDMVHNNIDGYDYFGCFIGPYGSAYEETVYSIDSYLDNLMFTPELINYKGVENATIEEVILKNIYDQSLVQIGKEVYGDGTIKVESKSAIFKFPVSTLIDSVITVSRLPIYAGIAGIARYYTIWGDESGSIVLATGKKPSNVDNFSLTLPEGSKYVVFSVYQRAADATLPSIAGIQIEYGSVITDYVSTKIPDINSMLFKKNETSVVLSNKPESTIESTIDILIFGDSITETDAITYNNDPANPYTTAISKGVRSNWPTFVYNQRGKLHINEFRNYAKSGASIRDRDIEDRQYLGFQIDEAIADLNPPAGSYYYGKTFSPDVIVISLGTNDGSTASTYESAMSKTIADGTGGVDIDLTMANLDQQNSFSEAFRHSLMKLRKQFPNAVYIYMTPIQRHSSEQPDSLITVSKQIASRFGCIICDTYNESGIVRDFQKSDGLSGDLYDGLHPNVNGQKKMARTIANKIIDNTTWIY